MTERTNRPLSLVVPCYNEARRLNVDAFRDFLAGAEGVHVLFVDDGSSDDTAAVLEEVRRGYEFCADILRCGKNGGKAEAVRLGFLHALANFQPAIIGFWDADLATPLELLGHLRQVTELEPQIEMVFGARVKLLGRHVERRAVRHYLGRIFATVVSSMLNLAIYDSQCGAKLFRVGPHTREIFAEPFLSKWVFDVEIVARYLALYGGDPKRLEKAIFEYPLEAWTDIAGSKVHPKDFLTALIDILRIRRKYLGESTVQTRQ